MVRTTFLLLGLLGAFLGRPSVEAATYYVATTGSDINSCAVAQSPATPLQTIAAGIACLSSGDTLLVGDGNYAETIEANTIPNGTSSARTILKAINQRKAVLRPSSIGANCFQMSGNNHFLTLDGFACLHTGENPSGSTALGTLHIGDNSGVNTFSDISLLNWEIGNVNADNYTPANGNFATTAAIGLSFATSNFLMDNLYIHDIGMNQTPPGCCNNAAYGYGIYWSASGATLTNSTFKNIAGFGIHGYTSATGGARLNVIKNNMFISTGAIYMSQDSNQFINNVLSRVGQDIGQGAGGGQQDGILIGAFGHGSYSNNVIVNNTIYQSKLSCINIGYADTATVRNNICYQNGSDGVNTSLAGSGNVIDHNLLGTNPLFVNAGLGDFHLQSGSPAIDAGVTVSVASPDLAGTPRPQGSAYDLGAYEFGGSPPAPVFPVPRNLRITATQ